MDYERKYKKSLEKIREGLQPLPDGTKISGVTKAFLEEVFPELKESEDERIRKAIHIYLDWLDGHKDYQPKGDYTIKDMLAWLEKQGETYTKRDVDDAWLKGMCDAKRELEKQDEQKTAEKIEPFDKYEGLTDFERTLADICIGWIGEEFGWKQYIKDNADVLLKIAVEKFNSVQDVPFEQNPATSYCQEHCKGYGKCFADGDCKDKRKAEQKSAWSEEDEKRFKNILSVLDVQVCWNGATGKKENPYQKEINWLKSLKDRVQPQPKQEWSEIDKNFMYDSLSNLTELKDRYGEGYGNVGKCIEWLNSIKQRIGG